MINLLGKLIVLLAFIAYASSKPLQGVKGGRRDYDTEVYVNPLRNDDYYHNEQYGTSRLEDRGYGRDQYHDRYRPDGQNRASSGQEIFREEGRNRASGPVGTHDGNRSSGPLNRRSYADQDVRYRGSQYRDNYDADYVGSRGTGYESRGQYGSKNY